MLNRKTVCVALLCLLLPTFAAAKEKAPSFRQPLQNLASPVAGPPSYNKGEAQGQVIAVYLSGSFGAFEVVMPDNAYARFECGNNASTLGCAALDYGDWLLVRYKQKAILAPYCGPWDGIINTAEVVLLYRWTGSAWQLLTTP